MPGRNDATSGDHNHGPADFDLVLTYSRCLLRAAKYQAQSLLQNVLSRNAIALRKYRSWAEILDLP